MRLFNRIGLCFAFSFVTTGSYVWAANFNPLPDTGQTSCYDTDGNVITCPEAGEPFYGQDAQYYGASSSYTDNSNGTVTDNNTGLLWQKGTADTNGDGTITSEAYPTGDKMTWQEAIDYCDGLTFAGRSDWHLPDVMELESIIDYSSDSANAAFDYESEYYWSADFPSGSTPMAWAVRFPGGGHGWPPKSYQYYVRCAANIL